MKSPGVCVLPTANARDTIFKQEILGKLATER
jgi:hypothetical protein